MTERSTEHDTFEIERVYEASTTRVFEAWSDPVAKAAWFVPSNATTPLSLDFRAGGREYFKFPMPNGMTFGYDSRYQEIVPGERIAFAYTCDFDETRISASLVTVEFRPAGENTRLLYTEQAVYFDGTDTPAQRLNGTNEMLDALGLAFVR